MKPKRFAWVTIFVCATLLTTHTAQAFYNPSTGRWLSRDPIEENGGENIHLFARNNPVILFDRLGMWASSVHHQLVKDWLTDPEYRSYSWGCCRLDVVQLIIDGSDQVDGVGPIWNWPDWPEAQSSQGSYKHGMRNGAANQSVAEASSLYRKFLAEKIWAAVAFADRGREYGDCNYLKLALVSLGQAYHAFSDSLSPAHEGFQPWGGRSMARGNSGLSNIGHLFAVTPKWRLTKYMMKTAI